MIRFNRYKIVGPIPDDKIIRTGQGVLYGDHRWMDITFCAFGYAYCWVIEWRK